MISLKSFIKMRWLEIEIKMWDFKPTAIFETDVAEQSNQETLYSIDGCKGKNWTY